MVAKRRLMVAGLKPREARHGLGRYFPFYNHDRPHQALNYRTPAEVYFTRRGT
jgi:transposase InsO family protein